LYPEATSSALAGEAGFKDELVCAAASMPMRQTASVVGAKQKKEFRIFIVSSLNLDEPSDDRSVTQGSEENSPGKAICRGVYL